VNCVCHDEPAYWQKDSRLRAGGFWVCAVVKRERSRRVDAARRDVKNARQRDRYDRDAVYRIKKRLHDNERQRERYELDAVYRIEKNLHDNARRRRQTIERRRAAVLAND